MRTATTILLTLPFLLLLTPHAAAAQGALGDATSPVPHTVAAHGAPPTAPPNAAAFRDWQGGAGMLPVGTSPRHVSPSVSGLPTHLAAETLQTGRRSHWRTGAVVGFVVGAAATAYVFWSGGSTALCDQDANQDAMRRSECYAVLAGGAVVGAGLGALVGWSIRR